MNSLPVGLSSYPVSMMVDCWAGALGVRVVSLAIPGSACGYYDDRSRTIFLDSSLSPIQRNSTFMHELGHAFFQHTACTPRWEREASEWAAKQLIDEDEFVDAMGLYEGAVAVANELGVLPRDIDNYVQWRGKNPADIVSRESFQDMVRTD